MTNKIFKSDLEAVKYIVKQSGETSWMLEKTTGISRQQIDRWLKNETKAIRRPTINKLAEKLGYQVTHNNRGVAVSPHIKMSEDKKMINDIYEDHISLQKEKIKALENRIEDLEQQAREIDEVQSYDYDNCMPTFCSVNELKLLPFRIKTISIDKTYMQLNHYLQAPQFVIQRAFEGDGNWHKWQDAPINELLTKQSSKYFVEASKNLKALIDTWRTFVIERTMAQKVEYTYKNNTVKTMVLTKIKFNKGKITTHSKSIIMENI